jgi:hypothetical protein
MVESQLLKPCEPDDDMVNWFLRKYDLMVDSPFRPKGHGVATGVVRKRARCDICHRNVHVRLRCRDEIYVCMDACLDRIASKTIASEARTNACMMDSPLELASGSRPKEAPLKLAKLVEATNNYRKAGFGSGWKAVASIADQHARGRKLTDKQIAVLEKFVSSCSREAVRKARK